MFFKMGEYYKVKYQRTGCEDEPKRVDMAFDMIFEELGKRIEDSLKVKPNMGVAKYYIVV